MVSKENHVIDHVRMLSAKTPMREEALRRVWVDPGTASEHREQIRAAQIGWIARRALLIAFRGLLLRRSFVVTPNFYESLP